MNRQTSIALAITLAISTVGVSSPASASLLDVAPLQNRQVTLKRTNEDARQQAICFDIPYWPWVICF